MRRCLAAAILGLLMALLTPASPASAHAVLQRTEPAAASVLPQAPAQVTLAFSESVQLLNDKIQILGPDGSRADQGQPLVVSSSITIGLNSQAQGTYLVSYRVVSADSHPIAGSFSFSVGAPSTSPPTAGTAELVDPVVRAAIPVAKGVGYVGLLLTVGSVMVLALLWPQRLSRRGPGRLLWMGMGLVGLSTVVGLWLQAPYTAGVGLSEVDAGDVREALSSRYGAVMIVRLAVFCSAAVLLRPLLSHGRNESRADLALLAVLGVAGITTWPLTGHPAASPVSGVSVVADAIHLSAMAVWLGGLVMLAGFLLPRANESELDAILPIWSRWATTAVCALAIAGVVQALVEVGALTALVTTTYGRLLLAKVAMVAAVLGVAAYSRALVIRHASAARTRLRRMIGVELAMTVVILAVTAVLVQTTPARTASANPPSAAGTTQVDTTLRNETFALQISVFPAQVGNNSIHLYAYSPDGKPLPIVEWSATAALPIRNIEPIEIPLLRITDNHAIGDVGLPAAGPWELRFTLRTSDVDQSSVSGTVTIK